MTTTFTLDGKDVPFADGQTIIQGRRSPRGMDSAPVLPPGVQAAWVVANCARSRSMAATWRHHPRCRRAGGRERQEELNRERRTCCRCSSSKAITSALVRKEWRPQAAGDRLCAGDDVAHFDISTPTVRSMRRIRISCSFQPLHPLFAVRPGESGILMAKRVRLSGRGIARA